MFIRSQGRSQNQSFPGRTPSLSETPRANGDIQLLQLLIGSRRGITLEFSVCDSQKSRQSAARPLDSVEGKVLSACHARPVLHFLQAHTWVLPEPPTGLEVLLCGNWKLSVPTGSTKTCTPGPGLGSPITLDGSLERASARPCSPHSPPLQSAGSSSSPSSTEARTIAGPRVWQFSPDRCTDHQRPKLASRRAHR